MSLSLLDTFFPNTLSDHTYKWYNAQVHLDILNVVRSSHTISSLAMVKALEAVCLKFNTQINKKCKVFRVSIRETGFVLEILV